jgi:hypothetical protein
MPPAKTQPALLGGVTIGVLSALPVVMLGNCCCCAWVLFGGALAAFLMQQNHPEPIPIGDGAVVGLLSGVIGACVWLIVSIPLNIAFAGLNAGMTDRMLRNSADLPPELRSLFENLSTGPTIGVGLVFGFFVMLVVMSMFGMLGGLFGALMFRKSPPPVIPPPIPPNSF